MKTIQPKIAHFGMNCFDQQLLMACQQLWKEARKVVDRVVDRVVDDLLLSRDGPDDFAGRLIDVFMFFLDGQPFFDKHNIIFVVLVFDVNITVL